MEKEKGYVYILTNPAFRENWVKIGKSSRPVDVRSKELDNTAVPLPFDIYATMCTVKYAEAEKLVHKYIERFTNLRIRNNREFFNVKPEEALEIFYDVQLVIDDAEIEVFQGKAQKPKSKSKKDQVKPDHHIFYCKRGGSNATGFLCDNGEFVVLAGSELRNSVCTGSKPDLIQKREEFIASFCTRTNDQIILNKDHTFPTPSAAALICIGGSANGWLEWIDANGITLDKVYRKK